MFTYAILDSLPAVPDKFISDALEFKKQIINKNSFAPDLRETLLEKTLNASVRNPSYRDRVVDINGQKITSTYSTRFSMGDEFNQWVNEIIYPSGVVPMECGITFIPGADIEGGRGHFGAHLDATRNYVLLYFLDLGGDNVKTTWFKQQGKPAFVPKAGDFDPVTVTDYTTLTEIESACFPLNQWVLLNSRVLHEISNIKTIRTSFQIGFNKNIWFNDDMIKSS